MKTSEFVTSLLKRGVKIWSEDGQLCLRSPKGVISPEDRVELSARKKQIIDLIKEAKIAACGTWESIVRVLRREELPVSTAQRRIWFLNKLIPDKSVYNEYGGLQIKGALDVSCLQKAFKTVIKRHESMRTVFKEVNGEPLQDILPDITWSLAIENICDIPREEQYRAIEWKMRWEGQRAFDLTKGPLIRGCLLELSEDEYALVIVMHHIISDAWSWFNLLNEIKLLYTAYINKEDSSLEDLNIQYADYAVWEAKRHKSEYFKEGIEFWKKELEDLPILDLPIDGLRSPMQTFSGKKQLVLLHAQTYECIKSLSEREGITIFNVVLTAFTLLLHRFTGQVDIPIGTTVAGRDHPDIAPLVGCFVNSVILRIKLSNKWGLQELLSHVNRVVRRALDHQYIPFEMIVDELRPAKDLSRQPLFQVMLNHNAIPYNIKREDTDLKFKLLNVDSRIAKFDLILQMVESEHSINLSMEYNSRLFSSKKIEQMANHLSCILDHFAYDDNRSLDKILYPPKQELIKLNEWNNTKKIFEVNSLLHELFERQAMQRPGMVALEYEGKCLSYEELNSQANQLAHCLRSKGVMTGSYVAIYIERGIEMIVSTMAILKAGAAYVPLETSYPIERMKYICRSIGIKHIISSYSLLDRAIEVSNTLDNFSVIICPERIKSIHGDKGGIGWSVACGEILWYSDLIQFPTVNLGRQCQSCDIAYIIYTSGSTGNPKGVIVQHKAVINVIQWINREFNINSSDCLLFITSLCFDLSVYDIFGILAAGGTIQIAKEQDILELDRLADLLLKNKITVWDSTPLTLQQIVQILHDNRTYLDSHSLRLVLLSGDWIPVTLPSRIKDLFPDAEIVGLGGATEATIWSNFFRIESINPNWSSIPYGKPIQNAQYYILDQNLQMCSIGIAGDLYIGGECLALGYMNMPDLTAENFIPDPYAKEAGARMYRTGDRARFFPDGNIEFLGRTDRQVKVRGFRIELGEIESVLRQQVDVKDVVVVCREISDIKSLIAYVVPNIETSNFIVTLYHFLKERLPQYMIPSTIITIDKLPLTANRKLDYSALPVPTVDRANVDRKYVAPRTKTEEGVSKIWASILTVDQIGANDDFFEMGGNSFLAVRAIVQMKERFGVNLAIRDIFQSSVVTEMAGVIDGMVKSNIADVIDEFEEKEIKADMELDTTISPGVSLAIDKPVEKILLTGANGFLGSFILNDLLQMTSATIYCLLRGHTLQEVENKLRKSLQIYGIKEYPRERIILLRGDISKHLMSLSKDDYDFLSKEIDVIYHNAANIDTTASYSHVRPSNVLGTIEIIRLACQYKLKPLHYVSTISVFDTNQITSELVCEDDYIGDSCTLRSGYEQTKWVAEKLVQKARYRGLLCSIYRPGVITGHSKTGVTSANHISTRILSAYLQYGILPNIDSAIDMTPVDYVSQALVYVSLQRESLGKRFHLCNPNPLQMSDISSILRQLGFPVRLISLDQLTELESLLGISIDNIGNEFDGFGQISALSSVVPDFLLAPRFSCTNTLKVLSNSGISCPKIDKYLLNNYISFLINKGFLDSPVLY